MCDQLACSTREEAENEFIAKTDVVEKEKIHF